MHKNPDAITCIILLVCHPDVSPEERVQNVGRILRKEVEDVTVRWKNLGAASVDWQQQLELAMERLMELQDAQDQLDFKLRQAEAVKNSWTPVGDLLVDDLQNHIDRVKVGILSSRCFGHVPWCYMKHLGEACLYYCVYIFIVLIFKHFFFKRHQDFCKFLGVPGGDSSHPR